MNLQVGGAWPPRPRPQPLQSLVAEPYGPGTSFQRVARCSWFDWLQVVQFCLLLGPTPSTASRLGS